MSSGRNLRPRLPWHAPSLRILNAGPMIGMPYEVASSTPMRNGVVWLVSYPGSGGQQLYDALRAVAGVDGPAGHDGAASCAAFERFYGVDVSDLTLDTIEAARASVYRSEAASHPTRRLLVRVRDCWRKTKAGEPLFPTEITVGAIVLVRDPRSVAAALASQRGISLDAVLADMANAQAILSPPEHQFSPELPQRIGDWSGHVESWLCAPITDTLVLRFEDLVADPVSVLQKAAAFAGLTDTGFAAVPEVKDNGPPWQSALNEEQATCMATTHGRVMAQFGYDVRYR